MLPQEVLAQARDEMLDWHGSGMSVMEMSHRGKEYMNIQAEAEADLRELLGIPANYKVLFLQGGASSQFAMVPGSGAYDWLRMQFGTGSLVIAGFSIPFVSILFAACVVLFVFIAHNTKYGKAVFAVGSNAKAARLSGVNTQRIQASVFMVTGLLVGVAEAPPSRTHDAVTALSLWLSGRTEPYTRELLHRPGAMRSTTTIGTR